MALFVRTFSACSTTLQFSGQRSSGIEVTLQKNRRGSSKMRLNVATASHSFVS